MVARGRGSGEEDRGETRRNGSVHKRAEISHLVGAYGEQRTAPLRQRVIFRPAEDERETEKGQDHDGGGDVGG